MYRNCVFFAKESAFKRYNLASCRLGTTTNFYLLIKRVVLILRYRDSCYEYILGNDIGLPVNQQI